MSSVPGFADKRFAWRALRPRFVRDIIYKHLY